MTQKICLEDQLFKMFQQNLADKWKDTLNEFVHAQGGNSGDYLKALASAWYNDTFNTGSLQKGIKSQQDVERLLKRGIVCPDGKTRKYYIDYNANFDGVDIYSDDYYEHGDHDDTIDSRTGQKWGPYEHITFHDSQLDESWSQKYKKSINCSHPKGFSQKAHCAGKKKHNESMMTMEAVCPDCGMCQTHGSLNEIAKGAKDSNGVTKCWPGKHAEGTKKGRNGGRVRNCVPNESQGVAEVAGAQKCWPGYRKTGTQPGTGKNAGKRVNDCEKIKEDEVDEAAKHGLYYNVNKRKKAGTSRPASSPKAPTAQAWKDAAKTAKKESVTEGSQHSAQEQINQILRSQAPNGDFTSDRYLDWIIGPESIDRLVQRTKLPLNRVRHYVTAFRQNPDPEGVAEGGGAQQAAIAIAKKKSGNYTKTGERLAKEDWNKVNHHDHTNGLSQKAVNSYRHEHPGSKLKTAVTTKPSKLKAGSKDAKRRKSFCARMSGNKGPMKTPSGKPTPKALALRRWNCESVEEMQDLIATAEMHLDMLFEKSTTEKQARTMAAAAHDPKFANKLGIKQSVAKDFNQADKGTKQLSMAMKNKHSMHAETQTMNANYPFAGKAVGQKTGTAGQLRGNHAGSIGKQQPAQGKLVGGG